MAPFEPRAIVIVQAVDVPAHQVQHEDGRRASDARVTVEDVLLAAVHLELVDHLLNLHGGLEAGGLPIDLQTVFLPALEDRPWDSARSSRVAFLLCSRPFRRLA